MTEVRRESLRTRDFRAMSPGALCCPPSADAKPSFSHSVSSHPSRNRNPLISRQKSHKWLLADVDKSIDDQAESFLFKFASDEDVAREKVRALAPAPPLFRRPTAQSVAIHIVRPFLSLADSRPRALAPPRSSSLRSSTLNSTTRTRASSRLTKPCDSWRLGTRPKLTPSSRSF